MQNSMSTRVAQVAHYAAKFLARTMQLTHHQRQIELRFASVLHTASKKTTILPLPVHRLPPQINLHDRVDREVGDAVPVLHLQIH